MREPLLFLLLFVSISCNGQNNSPDKIVGGPCEGCEAIFEYGKKRLTAIDTLPLFLETEPKLKITGQVFQNDGKSPAYEVLIYIYHTNRQGVYQTKGEEKGWAKRHGFIRGWVKTDGEGKYTFYTFRPAAYPSRDEPEHIHITVKEPGKSEYYLDEFVFSDDPLLTDERKINLENRGGTGIVKPTLENGILTIRRDLILGKNIPGYE
ncbi:protocatechuate 3,4-dioxygenase beta subunit [Algoriphagus iocasae]|uniref:Protocatechuate 3,4-dioxygenase beta subunit n=1 Tax=Algoriphagus iocasae TaxID=1836499 RepID=A0A841MM02_9BACT|nr:intradiol ring-cleavage dioxygenase [Algoriphagus iocasae]MBB6326459.1 protocatechuate 3,4-dioxygenase beta subunit [Algoriphagus iocasae]